MFRIIDFHTREVVSSNYNNYFAAVDEADILGAKMGRNLTVEYIGE